MAGIPFSLPIRMELFADCQVVAHLLYAAVQRRWASAIFQPFPEDRVGQTIPRLQAMDKPPTRPKDIHRFRRHHLHRGEELK